MKRLPVLTILGWTLLGGIAPGIAQAQGPLQRAGQALDNAGRTIRRNVEGAVARSQITAVEADLLGRVQSRLLWDKALLGAVLQLTVGPEGAVVLRGSVASETARKRAIDLTYSTVGVTAVADHLAVAKGVATTPAAPAVPPGPAQVIIEGLPPAVETRVVTPPAHIVAPGVEIVVPGRTVIEKR